MPDCLTAETIERYLSDSLDPVKERRAVESHLPTCPTCTAAVQAVLSEAGERLARRLAAEAAEAEHLDDEQLLRYVRGEVDVGEEERITAHLAACSRCRADEADLRQFRAEMDAYDWSSIPEEVWSASLQEAASEPGSPEPTGKAERPLTPGLHDGREQVRLNEDGSLCGLAALSPSLREQVRTALIARSIQAAHLGPPSISTGRAAPAASSFTLLAPIGTTVRSGRPRFRWQPLSGATGYTVHVVEDAIHREAAVSEPIPAKSDHPEVEWTLPEETPPLQPGRLYRWYVVAVLPDGSERNSPDALEPKALFRVLDTEEAEELERAEAAASGSPLALGILYGQSGLRDEAAGELRKVVAANPDSDLAQDLLRSLRSERPV
jgi:anti-sigma factor RsiW